ncbi:hypothetical protein QIS74_02056 [Colletotrichum tabaci]|uniref:Uncharacterized protein n=1 Tax=Colletotrichum tabaci TaxID=1209068 RepID=A0AAV9TR25_9PEZI
MNKNWNDRADKDLFFTILSVKNIGVISGSEWTTIGNHMRTLGYGFTNEGCNTSKVFVALSTRPRPVVEGPKSSLSNLRRCRFLLFLVKLVNWANPVSRVSLGLPKNFTTVNSLFQNRPMISPNTSQNTNPNNKPIINRTANKTISLSISPSISPNISSTISLITSLATSTIMSNQYKKTKSLDLPLKEDSLDLSLKEDNDDEQDGHDAKRIKLDNPPQDPSLVDDEAVLALAAHSDAPSVDGYASEYPTAGLTGSDSHSFSYGGEV